MEHDGEAPDLPVGEGVKDKLALELVRASIVVDVQAVLDVHTLGRVQELGRAGVVVHDKEGGDGDGDSEDTLEDEDPALTC